MRHVPMEADTRPKLCKTIRELRERLHADLRDEAERSYRLSLPLAKAELSAEAKRRRERLESWLEEQIRALPGKKRAGDERERFLMQAVGEAAYTWLNRLVLLRHLEAMGLSKPGVVTGGWSSKAYREFRDFAPGLCADSTEGYSFLLGLVFDELALDLPGLFGEVGLTELFPLPASILRAVVEALDAKAIESVWRDDTLLGWVYQYWNDPERERLDAKISARGKIEPHEIASKTQMFTDRYMVEWLLQNSLGAMWLATCQKHGWRPDAENVLDELDRRRAEWRRKREAGEVAPDAPMPVAEGLEERWKYYVPQPIPADAVEKAPESVRALKLLDPACGSGHFLVIAFDLLAALYEEEARHRGESWSAAEIAASIVENNLHGIDIDPRAVQIAAAALHVKAQIHARGVMARRMNLVAPTLRLSSLPEDDPSLLQLLREVKADTGIPDALTRRILRALEGADHLGSLLRVDAEIDAAIRTYEGELRRKLPVQGDLLRGFAEKSRTIDPVEARASLLDKLDAFLERHAGGDDLGLRLDGEQLAAGIRFVRMVREGRYDLVVGNPPYQGTSKMKEAKYVASKYTRGKADLYAAFLERGLQLVREGGVSALLTMRNWMFIKQFAALREHLLETYDLRLLGDVDRGAFEEVPNEVLAATMSIFRRSPPAAEASVALQPTPLSDKSYDRGRTARKRAALLAQVGRLEFDVDRLAVIRESPVVYWWDKDFLNRYAVAPKFYHGSPAKSGMATQDNTRFLRRPWEVQLGSVFISRSSAPSISDQSKYVPYIKGAEGKKWFEPLDTLVYWKSFGLELRVWIERYRVRVPGQYIKNESMYFASGIAFTPVGNEFAARSHRYRSIFGAMGSSVFPSDIASALCMMNGAIGRAVLESLNPGLHFEVGDVNRLPAFPVESADAIIECLDKSFGTHEAARETSVEFAWPYSSNWHSAQAWAQAAVDRPAGTALPDFMPDFDPPEAAAFVSFEVGIATGRFDAEHGGWSDRPSPDALRYGILFLATASSLGGQDDLGQPPCTALLRAWTEHGSQVSADADLHRWLRESFFDYHRKLYENRPIYFPLSSARRNFVAFALIHRWGPETLPALLATHLLPERTRLEGQLDDLRAARTSADKRAANEAERRFSEIQKLHAELCDFIDKVRMCADQGPPPVDNNTKRREIDAPFEMDLDDGVMINAAALWPLLEPQWKDPRKWWKELANADGKKDYDWSHLAARYFPSRVDDKCRQDPSLAVAHKCFWRYHPARAHAWELRLQDEIGPDFRIDEPDAAEHRTRFLTERPEEAAEIEAKELKRRQRKATQGDDEPQQELDFEGEGDEEETDAA
ncbi:BREX-6 system adenine-specific DNA-methyltransferase PglX [Vulgatibacter incomptus]|uniref:site-specific DNA-methyltransferase (adenine-specific) n=1 Tax=Vulgatibacter incomptus TaxID=1391653 RepID=A0A0K1PBK7_9BACT|nr:BREX-6 system adenine-specific DNA-methyltransferase PglX [Vulgatibacter incomptus]AKU90923.1 hypothetical protein AKJ08_1310 [Vulgatibacter incomptus]